MTETADIVSVLQPIMGVEPEFSSFREPEVPDNDIRGGEPEPDERNRILGML